jgi:uncharacterized protein YbjQ (UPF0145 family)
MGYSLQFAKDRALKEKIVREKHLAKNPTVEPDYSLAHPDEVRDAQQGNYTKLEKRLKEEHQKHLEKLQQRREKLGERI